MKRRTLALLLGVVMALSLTACGGGSSTPQEAAEPLDLSGVWQMEPAEDGTTIQATISGDTIVVNWVVDGDEWLYWSGNYDAPGEPGDSYSWTSQNDGKSKSALMGASQDTKEFNYNGGVLSFDITMYFEGTEETGTVEMERIGEAPAAPAPAQTLKIGDTWTVDGQWTMTITGVTATDERNEYDERNPAAVYIVDYTYTNDGYEDPMGVMNGLYLGIDHMIVDSAGQMGYSYPGTVTYYAQETPVGATCKAQACIGVDNAGDFKVTVSQYDGNDDEQEATFLIEVD